MVVLSSRLNLDTPAGCAKIVSLPPAAFPFDSVPSGDPSSRSSPSLATLERPSALVTTMPTYQDLLQYVNTLYPQSHYIIQTMFYYSVLLYYIFTQSLQIRTIDPLDRGALPIRRHSMDVGHQRRGLSFADDHMVRNNRDTHRIVDIADDHVVQTNRDTDTW